MGEHQGGALHLRDDVRDGVRLAGARRAQQGLEFEVLFNALH